MRKKKKIEKITCEICEKLIDPRGMRSHKLTHTKPYPRIRSVRRFPRELPIAVELQKMHGIIKAYQQLSTASQQYIKSRL